MERELLFGLHETKGIGSATIERLFVRFQPFTQLLKATKEDLQACGLSESKASAVMEGIDEQKIAQAKLQYEQCGIKWLTIFDEQYPALLRQVADPPWVIYYRGHVELFDRSCIAVVGTRTPTAYGRKVAYQFSRQLSEQDFCVVSGLARGIDACAHAGALEGSGRTIAVLGTGIDQMYPPENKALFAQIEREGLIVSEYPIGTPAKAGMFPRRNRIIAGLSLGTLVIEAAERSGSLITADLALEESRDVFAVPGPITSRQSEGTLALIREGAKMTLTVEDITSEYDHKMNQSVPSASKSEENFSVDLSPDEAKILSYLSGVPVSFDEIMEFSKFNFGHLHSVLLSLLMKKKIEQLPGSLYISL